MPSSGIYTEGHRHVLLHKPAGMLTHPQTTYTASGAIVPDTRACALSLVRVWWCQRQRLRGGRLEEEGRQKEGKQAEQQQQQQQREEEQEQEQQGEEQAGGRGALMHVGRLDIDTTGALLFTTDQALSRGLLGPGSGHAQKVYLATLRGGPAPLSKEAIERLRRGVLLPGKKGRIARGEARNVGAANHTPRRDNIRGSGAGGLRAREVEESALVELSVAEGAFHQVKRMLALVGRPLWRLHRLAFCGISVEGLREGECRVLTRAEEEKLYAAAAANANNAAREARGAGEEEKKKSTLKRGDVKRPV